MCRKCLKIRLSIHRYTTVGWSLARHRALVHSLMLLKRVRRRGWRWRRQSSSAKLGYNIARRILNFLVSIRPHTQREPYVFLFGTSSSFVRILYPLHRAGLALPFRFKSGVWLTPSPSPLHNTYRRQCKCRLRTDVSRDGFSGAGVRCSLWLY